MREAERGGIEERAAPEIVDDDRAVSMGDRGHLGDIGRLGEAGHREVRWMDAQRDLRPAFGQGSLVIGGTRPVGRPDLDETRARASDDLGDPHTSADLDELAARDDHSAATSESDGHRHGRRVVVGDEGVLRAGQGDKVVLGHARTGPPTARGAIELEEEVAAGKPGCRVRDAIRPRRPAQVRVDDDPSRVDDRLDARAREALQAGASVPGQLGGVTWRCPIGEASTLGIDDGAGDVRQCRRIRGRAVRPQHRQDPLDAGWPPCGCAVFLDDQGRLRLLHEWRERVGVEPTAPRRAPRHWF